MRDFKVAYFGEINFVTEWMSDTPEGLELLRENSKSIAQDLLKFLTSKDNLIEGIHIHYYYLDSNFFGEDGKVVKWSVTLRTKKKKGLTENMSGHHPALTLK